MSFAAPTLLLGLVLVPVLIVAYVFHERRRERRAAAWVNPALVPNLVHRPSPRFRHVPAVLFLLGLTLLLVGFARPQAKLTTSREGATIVVAIDNSGSMAAADVKPTRLLNARNAMLTFLDEVPKQYRVSLITFTDHPAVLVPPTYNRKLVAAALPMKTLDVGTLARRGGQARRPGGSAGRRNRQAGRAASAGIGPLVLRRHADASRARRPRMQRSSRTRQTCRSRRSPSAPPEEPSSRARC